MRIASKSFKIKPADGEAFLTSAINATPSSRRNAPAKSRKSLRFTATCFSFPACERSFATSSFFSATIVSRIFTLFFICHTLLARAWLAGLEPDTDKWMNISVHDALHVTGLMAGAQVLDHLVRLKDVTADLIAPGHRAFLPVVFFHRGALLVLFLFVEARLQHRHRQLTVLVLAALVLALDHDAGRQVRHTNRCLNLVHILSALAAGPECVHLHVFHLDFDFDRSSQLRDHIH